MEWIKEHKYYALSAIVVVIFGIYYFVWTQQTPVLSDEVSNWDEMDETTMETVETVEEQEVVVEEILVDVKGAVKTPGVYKANIGERVIDVIEQAGGLKETADDSAVNFAMKLTDEMVLYVPEIGEESKAIQEGVAITQGEGGTGKVNLNKASQAELETLPGIGAAKAQAIIEYRETSGPFKTIEDLMSISGFGEKTFEKLKDSISVN